jgi:hypothetical protein
LGPRTSNEVFADPAANETDGDLVVLFTALRPRGLRVALKFTIIPHQASLGDVWQDYAGGLLERSSW